MSNYVQERYKTLQCPANATTAIVSNGCGGFLATVSGFISIITLGGVTRIPTVAVTAGVYLPMPFHLGVDGGSITTSGGAAGVLFVD